MPDQEQNQNDEIKDPEISEELPVQDAEEQDQEQIDVSFEGDEEDKEDTPSSTMPPWVRDLRKKHEKKKKRIAELEKELEQFKQPATATIGEKPTMESCDYDQDLFDKRYDEWHKAKAEIEAEEHKKQRDLEEQNKWWQGRLDRFEEKKQSLRAKDYEDAESLVKETLNQTQQAIIVHVTDDPALMFYALGKSHKRAQDLAKITNPVEFAYRVAKEESKLSIKKRKPATAPEKTIKGTGSLAGTTDSTLDRLRKEASESGDYSKVNAYRREQRRKAG